MKKLLLSAIACVAFAGTANAQISDSLLCNADADAYADRLKDQGYDQETIDARRAGYYAGCMEQKKKQRGEDLAPKPVIIAPRPKIGDGDGGVIIRF